MKVILAAFTVLIASVPAAALCTPSTPGLGAIAKEIRAQVEASDQFPAERTSSIHWYVKPAEGANKARSPRIGVVRIQFSGLTNSYCRFVASKDVLSSSFALIPVPESANHDACKGIRSFQSGDLNGDGHPDYWYVVQVQSNRGAVDVGEAQVFLSQSGKAEAFCYSTTASRAIDPSTTSQAAVTTAVNGALKRLRLEKLECD